MMLTALKELGRVTNPTSRRTTRTGLSLARSVIQERRFLDLSTSRGISGNASGGNKSKGMGKGGRGPGVEGKQRRSGGGERGAKGGGVARATKGGSSGLWMKRHLKDPYVSAAIEAGAPSRAAFKLVEINDKHGVLSAGDRVVDLGAAPGGWSLVAARIVHARGARSGNTQQRGRGGRGGAPPALPPPLPEARIEAAERRGKRGGAVVAVDLLDLETDLPGVETIRGDFRDQDVESKIFASLASRERPPDKTIAHQQQQGGSPSSPHPVTTNAEERLDLNDKQEDHRRDSLTTDDTAGLTENNHRHNSISQGEAFLLRGTSASRALLPRPEQPQMDNMEELFLSANKIPPPTTNADTPSDATKMPLSSPLTGHVRPGVFPERVNNRAPCAEPRPTASHHRHRRRASVVLSDMAPSFSGDRDTDQARVAALVLDALAACLGDESARRIEPSTTQRGGGVAGESPEPPDGASGGQRGQGERGNVISGDGDFLDSWGSAGSQGMQGAGAAAATEVSGKGSGVSSEDARIRPAGEEILGSGSGLLARGGTFLGKFFAGRDEREVKEEAQRLFETVKVVKPRASRSGSGEMYLLAKGFLIGGNKK